MLTRTAIYEGTIHAGKEEEFFARVRDELEPLVAAVSQRDGGAGAAPPLRRR